MTNSTSADHPPGPARVVQAALDAFNRGDAGALIPRAGDESDTRSGGRARWRPRRGSLAATVFALDPGTISVRHISCLDGRRVVCGLVTPGGDELVGIYSVDEGRITAAHHYFSDVEMLVSVGILDEPHRMVAAGAPGPQ